jgi:hypothetical protein
MPKQILPSIHANMFHSSKSKLGDDDKTKIDVVPRAKKKPKKKKTKTDDEVRSPKNARSTLDMQLFVADKIQNEKQRKQKQD